MIQELVVDIQTREGSVIGSFYIVTGEFTEWYRTNPGVPYNHAKENTVDGNVCGRVDVAVVSTEQLVETTK